MRLLNDLSLIMMSSLLVRSSAFAVRRSVVRQAGTLHSSAPWLEDAVDPEQPSSTTDSSAMSRSRAPFRMPKRSEDDSVPTGEGGVLAWSKLGLLSELVESVHREQGLDAPTPVQQMVIPDLLKEPPESLAFLAATGSGKTLAYALPLLQMVKSQELFADQQSKPKRPRVLILAPTRELAAQITSVVKQLCHKVKLSSQSVIGSEDYGKQRKALDRRLDILVATPGRLLKHWRAGNVYLGDVGHVVLDEMDTMLEQGFQAELQQLLHPLLYKSKGNVKEDTAPVEGAPAVVLTSATMTQAVSKLIAGSRDGAMGARRHHVKQSSTEETDQQKQTVTLPKMKVIKAPGLHKAVPRLQQVFVDVGNVDKLTLLSDVVHSGGRGAAVKKSDTDSNALTIVFCNTVASARAAEHALTEAGLSCFSYHGELNSLARRESLKQFRAAGQSEEDQENAILVCTDLAARGLDVPEVDHVVMFDFPLNALDYLHRAGRTARGVAGERKGNGRVTALVAKRDRVLATAIENAVQRGDPLDGLSSRKSDYIPSRASPSQHGAPKGGGRGRTGSGGNTGSRRGKPNSTDRRRRRRSR